MSTTSPRGDTIRSELWKVGQAEVEFGEVGEESEAEEDRSGNPTKT